MQSTTSIGYLNVLDGLLTSPGDASDPRNGKELVRAKVRQLWMMGGKWPAGSENNFNRSTVTRQAASRVVSRWPAPIAFLGWEISDQIAVGGNLVGTAASDPVASALKSHGSENGRSAWDPMLVWLASLGDCATAGYRFVTGTARVSPEIGDNEWSASSDGRHHYVIKSQPDEWYAAD